MKQATKLKLLPDGGEHGSGSRSPKPLVSYRLAILKMTRLLSGALAAGEQGLLLHESEAVRKAVTGLETAYDEALEGSFKISLTTADCATLDQQSHEIEILRSKLRKLISDLRNQETSLCTSSPLG